MMTTIDILRLVRRWWWVIVIGPVLGAVVAYLISSTATPIYQASAMVVIESANAETSANYSDIIAAERMTRTYSRLVEMSPALEQSIDRLALPLTVEELRGKISVSPVRDTQLLAVSVTDPSPARAADIANTVAEVFIEQRTAQERELLGTSSAALAEEIDTVREDITAKSTEIDEYKARPDAETPTIAATIRQMESQLAQMQTLYNTLLDRQIQLDITQNQQATRMWVAEEATPPAGAISPRVALNTALGGILGLVGAGALVMVIGYLDNTVKTSDDVRRLTNSAALGSIPLTRSKDGLEPLLYPRSPATEAYRALRTNLQFASLGRDVRSLVATSPRPGDGKTTTISNLATVLAQGGQRVILVDADLRKPRLHKMFAGLANRTGLTNLLLADARVDLDPLLQPTAVPGLRVLTTGPLPPNPSDVLNSPRMRDVIAQLEESADVVLIDAPPMAVSDALIVASLVDGVMLVTTGGRTRANELTSVVEALARSGTTLTGVVINRASMEGESYYYYQSYYSTDSDAAGSDASVDDTGGRRRLPARLGRRSTGAES